VADSSDNKGNWAEKNLLHPAVDSLKEMANTGINLVNLALPKKDEFSKYEINYNEPKTTVGMLVSGAISVVPYALAGGVLGRVLRCVPAGESGLLLHSEQLAQIGGAAAYDGLRDVRPGETKFGNVLGSVAGFGTFEAGNYAIKGMTFGGNRAVQLAAQLPLRFGVGLAGGTMGALGSDLGSLRKPDLAQISESAITSGGMNVLLPTAQSLIFKGLGLRSSAVPAAHADSSSGAPADAPVGKSDLETNGSHAKSNDVHPVEQTDAAPTVPHLTEQEPVSLPTTPRLKLSEMPGWSVFRNYAVRLNFEEMERAKAEPDEAMPQFKQQQIEDAITAQRNMEKIARGELSDETHDYIKRGWLPADALQTAQAKLGADLSNVTATTGDTGNVADLAGYKHQFLGDRKTQLQELTWQYQGSTTRLMLKALGADSETLGDLYRRVSTADNASQNIDPAKIDSMSAARIAPGPTRSTKLEIAKFTRAISWAERSLANPETREATVKELDAARMNHNPLVDRYASAELGLNRPQGPVDLAKYPSWHEAYRTLVALEKHEQEHDGRFAHDPHNAGVWTRRALTHMEQIATGDFPPAVKAEFEKHPEVLNQMRAQLEYDLNMQYRKGSEPFSKESLSSVYGAYSPLLRQYEVSPMYRFIQATTGDIPPQLNVMYHSIRHLNPAWHFISVDDGLKALYAIERGLMDHATANGIRANLKDRLRYGNDYAPVHDYASVFDRKYRNEPQPEGPSDHSNVVQFNPQRQSSIRESATPNETASKGEATSGQPSLERAPNVQRSQRSYSPDPAPTSFDFSLSNDDKVRIGFARMGSRAPWTWTPDFIEVKSESGLPFMIEKAAAAAGEQLPHWSIESPGAPRLSRYGEIEAHEGGRELSIFGRKIPLKSATPEDIAQAFMLKPPIDPVIKPQVEQFERLAAPLDELQFDSESDGIWDTRRVTTTVNGTIKQMDAFLSAHQSAAFKDAMLDWADRNPNDMVRSFVTDYYRNHPNAWTRYFEEVVHEEADSATNDSSARQGLADLMQARSGLPKMLERGVTREQLQETQDNLLRLLDDGRDPQSISKPGEVIRSEDYKRAALQAFIHAANPDSISQWAHPTCALAGIEHLLYKKHPEIATSMLRDALETGKFVTTDGTTITLDPVSIQPESTALRYDRNQMETPYRTYASQILQMLLGNIYWQRATVNPDGVAVPKGSLRYELKMDSEGHLKEKVVDYAHGGKQWKQGFNYDEVEDIHRQIAPNVESARVPSEAYGSRTALQDWLSSVPKEKFPVRIGVDARHLDNDFSSEKVQYHAMNINGVFDPDVPGGSNKTMAEVKNPQTGKVQNMTIYDLWKMAWQRPDYTDNPQLIPKQLTLSLGDRLHLKPRTPPHYVPPEQLEFDFSQPAQLELDLK
jgi:hypothetical protein